MKMILSYIRNYFQSLNRTVFSISVFFSAVLVFVNYRFGLNRSINQLNDSLELLGWLLVFLIAFGGMYVMQALVLKRPWFTSKRFIFLIFFASAIFAWKMSFDFHFLFTANETLNVYINKVLYWPWKLAVITTSLWLVWKFDKHDEPFYGVQGKNFQSRPYLFMLLAMVPLIAFATTQPDFQAAYPKWQNVVFLKQEKNAMYFLLYELSYGSDFITIELFFRGFLVLAFLKYAGKEAILPMAVFYCTIHFGKPLGECISSFFGGLILGIITYHTKNILGGLMVHLGIAWLMELAGAITMK